MSEITVYKLDVNGDEVWQYPATVLERQAKSMRLEATFNRDDHNLGFAVFKRGDRFVEIFYTDRWYNIFAVYDRDDEHLKGWYCNICRPAEFNDSAVRCEDLALDVWVWPDRQIEILDEDEFAALPISDMERQACLHALRELQAMASTDELPR